MQPHTGVQVLVVGLAGHVGHGEVHHSTVGDGHCRGKQRVSQSFNQSAADLHPETGAINCAAT